MVGSPYHCLANAEAAERHEHRSCGRSRAASANVHGKRRFPVTFARTYDNVDSWAGAGRRPPVHVRIVPDACCTPSTCPCTPHRAFSLITSEQQLLRPASLKYTGARVNRFSSGFGVLHIAPLHLCRRRLLRCLAQTHLGPRLRVLTSIPTRLLRVLVVSKRVGLPLDPE